ncbi:TerB family tellurite resistance protein [Paenibacillus paridis]|uniref:TerB family tellurite resistance protein n=1 Tax=Paenibacillus paridis TaxID=2583376 RepID=UPI00111F332F|nr:TerB family tellurite resistance protein [Paenibacillus paridis]
MFLHFLQTKEHKEAFLELAHLVASADGFVHKKERDYLQSFMEEMEIKHTDISFSKEKQLGDIIGGLKDEHIKNIFFAEILLLIYADGDFNDDEKKITNEMKQVFGFSDETFEALRNWVVRMEQLKVEGLKLILNT